MIFSSSEFSVASILSYPEIGCLYKYCPKTWEVLKVLFLSNKLPAKSASEYLIKSKDELLGYQSPKCKLPLRYLKILLIAFKLDSLGLD